MNSKIFTKNENINKKKQRKSEKKNTILEQNQFPETSEKFEINQLLLILNFFIKNYSLKKNFFIALSSNAIKT